MAKTPVAVLASGRGSNMLALMGAAEAPGFPARVALVLSDNEEAPALASARAAGIDALFIHPGPKRARVAPEAEDRMAEEVRARGAELVCLAGFMRILSPRFLDAFPRRVLNIHPSLLPSFPGLHAQRQAFEHGVRVAGCTTHLVEAGVDSGPILMQEAVPVKEGDTEESLAARILEREHRIYPETVRRILTRSFVIRGRRVVWKEKGAAP
ncbi:MAG: phosphoribosylglycinamide formyltransferase [Candidatus Eisenbacteria bacterium]